MDGTLYYKYPMRLSMAFLLGSYYLFHFKCRKELFVLRDYRRLREKEELLSKPDYEETIRQTLSVRYGYEVQKVDEVLDQAQDAHLCIYAGETLSGQALDAARADRVRELLEE